MTSQRHGQLNARGTGSENCDLCDTRLDRGPDRLYVFSRLTGRTEGANTIYTEIVDFGPRRDHEIVVGILLFGPMDDTFLLVKRHTGIRYHRDQGTGVRRTERADHLILIQPFVSFGDDRDIEDMGIELGEEGVSAPAVACD
jgi:hypothetical protein